MPYVAQSALAVASGSRVASAMTTCAGSVGLAAVARLMEQLGGKKFAERESAGKALIAAGDDAYLEAVMRETPASRATSFNVAARGAFRVGM